jgi:tetratricopeptide (TPR) repeat protein
MRPLALLAALALSFSAQAGAGGAADADVARAKEHFRLGHVHYKAGRYADAVREFEAANAIKPHPIFLFDMAQAYRLAGDAAHAIEMYRAYLAVDPMAKNRKSVEQKIEVLRAGLLAGSSKGASAPAAAQEPVISERSGAVPASATVPAASIAPAPGAAPEKGKAYTGLVAVLEFRSKLQGDERKEVDAGYLADVVRRAALRAGPGIEVITRENLLVLLKAAGKSGLAECEGECEVETGRKVGADLVVSGDLLRFGSSLKLDLKLHDTRSGKLLSSTIASGKSVDDLDQQAQRAAVELLAGR